MMSWWKKQAQAAVRTLLYFVLFMLLLGCGSTSRGRNMAGSPKPTRTVPPVTVTDKNDIAGLHIEVDQTDCRFDYWFGQFFTGNLVLKDNYPNPYGSSELQQIEKYSQTVYDTADRSKRTEPPAPLSASPGGSGCGSDLAITNISQTTIQLQSVSMRLITAPKPNSTHYSLIDICSMLPVSEKVSCPPSFGGGNPLGYAFQLKKSPIGTVFQPQSSSGSIALKPNDVAYIDLSFTSADTPDNLIYSVVPELILSTGTIELKSATMELVFADKEQFACVQLSKNTFVPELPIPSPYLPDGSPSDHWCV
jgi:hypothetical protein